MSVIGTSRSTFQRADGNSSQRDPKRVELREEKAGKRVEQERERRAVKKQIWTTQKR